MSGDHVIANHYTSTHPDSIFVHTLTAQLSRPEVRHILRGNRYIERRGDRDTERRVSDDELDELLRAVFGLTYPDS